MFNKNHMTFAPPLKQKKMQTRIKPAVNMSVLRQMLVKVKEKLQIR